MKRVAAGLLLAVFVAVLLAGWIAPYRYDEQRRDEARLSPRAGHWLGTDELGRDRFSRLLYGARVSLLLAPAAALLSTFLAAAVGLAAGGLAGRAGGWGERILLLVTDLFLGLPWLFLLLAVRAALPLNVGAAESLAITMLLLGGLGWPGGARVVRASCAQLRDSNFVLQAEAAGQSPARLLWRHLAPNLRPVLAAQFLVSVPAFLLAEANLGMLGLGVTEPLPSLGNLLAEITTLPPLRDAAGIVAPALLLVAVLSAFHFAVPSVRSQRSPS
jgi:ABC-type dipeptide/oligopeptide/nickel transport system permease subunit